MRGKSCAKSNVCSLLQFVEYCLNTAAFPLFVPIWQRVNKYISTVQLSLTQRLGTPYSYTSDSLILKLFLLKTVISSRHPRQFILLYRDYSFYFRYCTSSFWMPDDIASPPSVSAVTAYFLGMFHVIVASHGRINQSLCVL